jgi:hypothetical protein
MELKKTIYINFQFSKFMYKQWFSLKDYLINIYLHKQII